MFPILARRKYGGMLTIYHHHYLHKPEQSIFSIAIVYSIQAFIVTNIKNYINLSREIIFIMLFHYKTNLLFIED
jgi:hypothetical protein